jgi:large subunit ribosomal protein L31
MKTDIHPKYFAEATIVCACGHTWKTGATKERIDVEICSNCHPFYTGEEKLIDTAGRLEKFQTRRAKASTAPKVKKVRTKKEAAKK